MCGGLGKQDVCQGFMILRVVPQTICAKSIALRTNYALEGMYFDSIQ